MRLLKAMIVLVALLDVAMFLQSSSSPLSATTPSQVVSYASADNPPTDTTALIASSSRP